MRFDHQFEVAGTPAQVKAMFADLPRVASFLPGATVDAPDAQGAYPATLLVSFGPKRITFRGSLQHQPDPAQPAGTVIGHAGTDLRGAKLSVTLSYTLSEVPSGTRVDLVSEAEMTGMLAEFARTGGVALTQALLDEFAERFSAWVKTQQTPAAAAPSAAPADAVATAAFTEPAGPAQPAQALSLAALLWRSLKAKWRAWRSEPRG